MARRRIPYARSIGFAALLAALTTATTAPAQEAQRAPEQAARSAPSQSTPARKARSAKRAATAAARRATALESAAQKLEGGAQTLSARLSAVGRRLNAQKATLAHAQRRIDELNARKKKLSRRAALRRKYLAQVLGALETLSRTPAPAMLAHPSAPLDAARGAMLMADMTPKLDRMARQLRADLDRIADMRAQEEAARGAARAASIALRADGEKLARLLNARQAETAETRGEAKRLRAHAAELAATARSLGEIAAAIEAESERPAPRTPFPHPPAPTARTRAFQAARGLLTAPVVGRVAARFHTRAPEGGPLQGLRFETSPHSLVVSPWDATIRYAGPFLNYGNIVILEPQKGYLMLLAGLGTLDRKAGDQVETGEPIGRMGGPPPAGDEFLVEISKSVEAKPIETLYMEIRRRGEPIDPARWLNNDKEKVSGL